MKKPVSLPDEISRYFSLYGPTITLAQRLIDARENAQDVLLLLCARLDALASTISNENQSNRDAFMRLAVDYGGERRLMESVSAGDLFYELGYHRWLIEGLIPKPGRIERFSRIDDPVIALLEESGIPLTVDAGGSLLTRIMNVVQRLGRCRAGQPRKKPNTLRATELSNAIKNEFQGSRVVDSTLMTKAVQPLLSSKMVGGLLYENFRNQSIHGITVQLDEARFFREPRPFWQPLYSERYPPFLMLKFPAPFLLTLLQNSINTLKGAWCSRGKVPPEVHWHLFGYGLDRLEYLDSSLLPEVRSLRFQRNRS